MSEDRDNFDNNEEDVFDGFDDSDTDDRESDDEDVAIDVPAGAPVPAVQLTEAGDVLKHNLKGMYRSWFLEYASYVILDRAVPNIEDGLKPVQRRILHSMKTLDDGRFNKVANIVGNTMQYHPHGDASIKDALVQIGQKELLVETQGNWGNILTGASAAAGRYIEARLAPFALEVLYSPKVTEWTKSYDGRKDEPVTLPAKFPVLLVQGAEGIAVGLSSKILPHNFNEICDALVAALRGEEFSLMPDFVTGGFVDVSRYNDGERGGAVRIRAKIEKIDSKTLAITEIPFGKTTGTVIASIVKAYEKGKIKIRKVEDQTAETARIIVHLQQGTSSDKAIDALYAFSDCEVSVSPNCCVISDRKPCFLTISDLVRHSADRTRSILAAELRIQLGEVSESLMFASLEKYFIEKRIYKDKAYEEAPDIDAAVAHIDGRLEPLKKKLIREVTRDDILKLLEIRMKRILKFNAFEADRQIEDYNNRIAELNDRLEYITDYTIAWFEKLKEKYGAHYPRHTEIRGFDTIDSSKVAEANERLFFNREEGFVGTGLKPEPGQQPLAMCSSLDDIIIFYRDGRYKVVKVQEKYSVGKGRDVIHIAVFKKNDVRTIYNVIYQNGKGGAYYQKRFNVTGVTRDREYNLTQDRPDKPVPGSKVVWFTANPNGEAEVVRVILKPMPRLKTLQLDVDFAKLGIKGRQSMGNLVTRNEVHSFKLKERGLSTLGGRKVWFDPDVLRINYEGRGDYLGEFQGDDKVLVIMKNGTYFLTTFDETNHYEPGIERIERFRPGHVWTAIYDSKALGYPYIKRFTFEPTTKPLSFIGDDEGSELISLSDHRGARYKVTFGGHDAYREAIEIDAADFIGLTSFKAKGKRLTAFEVGEIEELEPLEPEVEDVEAEEIEEPEEDVREVIEPDKSDEEIRDELTGQGRLF